MRKTMLYIALTCLVAAAGAAISPTGAFADAAPDHGGTAGGTDITLTGCDTQGFAELSGGGTYTLALDHSGQLYAWGYGSDGRLGTGNTNNALVPTPADTEVRFQQIYAGSLHSLGLDTDGNLYAWGANDWGQVEPGVPGQLVSTPRPVDLSSILNGAAIKQALADSTYSMVVLDDGRVFGWGLPNQGILGIGPTTAGVPTTGPVQVGGTTAAFLDKEIVSIAGGSGHVLALASDNTLWAWGDGSSGELGTGFQSDSDVPVQVRMDGELAGKTIAHIAVATGASFALTTDGEVYAWGTNGRGRLGVDDPQFARSPVPTAVKLSNVPAGRTIIGISANTSTMAIWDDAGSIYLWGTGQWAQSGQGAPDDNVYLPTPIAVAPINDLDITQVAMSTNHVTALDATGTAYSWGWAASGVLGNGTVASIFMPPGPVSVGGLYSAAFGTVPATGITAGTDGFLVTSPAHPSGIVDVKVQFASNPAVVCGAFTFGTAPTIATAPAGVRLPRGGTATFDAVAEGDEAPTAQWQILGASGVWEDVSAGVVTTNPDANSTHTVLTLPNLPDSASGWKVKVAFSNGLGTVTSNDVLLLVEPPAPTATASATPTSSSQPPEPTATTATPTATPTPLAQTGATAALPLTGAAVLALLAGATALAAAYRVRARGQRRA